ncbi:MAG: peptidoglycan-binding protein [Synechococcales cyanobacterium T60_A2020_003]|nr:peptidoglycan-binding protein [Synechococcales cyanobacterium T60_A2020_003]
METLAYLHHSTAFERPEEYEISFDWEQVNLLDSTAVSKLSTKGAMYLLAATCGLGVAVASEEAHAALFPGDSGASVATLQQALLNAGYDIPGAVTTYYGPQTASAVRQLQADCGIAVDGIFGYDSENCLYGGGGGPVGGGLLRYGSTGPEVSAWQNALISAGYSVPGAPSNYFGSATDAATRQLQADCGLVVDGVVGPQTRGCIGGPGPVGGGLLRYGSTGPEVSAWQNALISAGYSVPGAPSNYFGSATDAATRQLQADCGLVVDGVVGPQTRGCIGGPGPVGGGLLRFGDTGAAVVDLQLLLISKGYLGSGLATGYFGTQTEAAVRAAQADCGIAVDGIVGPSTRVCLASR